MTDKGIFNELIQEGEMINPYFGQMLENGIDFVPYIGKLIQTVKINRLIRRFKEHDKKINFISHLAADSVLSSEYISQRIFPIIFSDLFEEHEDAKINLILNGFENVFIEENKNESVIINFYDMLRNLRYLDLKRLFYLAGLTEETITFVQESDVHGLIRNIDRRLENNGLLNIKKTFKDIGNSDSDKDRDDIEISLYGKNFLKFILEGNGLQ
ncbi:MULTISPECIES: hypothetical protein [unclassified Paenibacillus]|uniref:hypothetical protein n=1 Tax=unclassified Paenibacillus TaxID=185978 RepID=UPI0009A68C53|nr:MULTISPECIES: hypothetical protein [unclassified Paenibacillus]SLK12924.1 hypothetical protein SAMN06272722_10817 [Paenibacillus sp. RU5A]SOC72761.1 hypothetical protein SAMN05880581_10817 [Paenibacillus sp. RU26A]SOC75040.1 hypothetical protein SAMN05880586_10817 [Paenibacillus sp. RU5M]